ncbi:MAG: M23 family metallopeptidase [Lachnospiraceae bacterium]|nr:M23 family metallopeptidase [Lachnospiraceae bacterium]
MRNNMRNNMKSNMRNKFIASTSLCVVGFLGIVFATYYTKDDGGNKIELKKVEKVTVENSAAQEDFAKEDVANAAGAGTDTEFSNVANAAGARSDAKDNNNDGSDNDVAVAGDIIPGNIAGGDRASGDREVYQDYEETQPFREKTEENPIEGEGNLKGLSTEVNAAINALSFNKKSNLLWPVEGNIILEYNMDNTIYFPTLNEYKTNPSIVIQSEEFAPVIASAKGVVTEIGENDEIGVYIKTAIGNDYEVTYGQIINPTVEEGQVVDAGDVIACVNKPTKFYEKEGYNLNFAVTKKGKAVDPMKYLTVNE